MDFISLRFATLAISLISMFYAKLFLSKSCRDEIISFRKKFNFREKFFVFVFFIINFIFFLFFLDISLLISSIYSFIVLIFIFVKGKKGERNKFFHWFFSLYLFFFFFFPKEVIFAIFPLIILFNLVFFSYLNS